MSSQSQTIYCIMIALSNEMHTEFSNKIILYCWNNMCKQCLLFSKHITFSSRLIYMFNIISTDSYEETSLWNPHREKHIEAECPVFYWNKRRHKKIAQFNHRQRVCAWVAARKKCIMFVIICPLFVGKLRALTYESIQMSKPLAEFMEEGYTGIYHHWPLLSVHYTPDDMCRTLPLDQWTPLLLTLWLSVLLKRFFESWKNLIFIDSLE